MKVAVTDACIFNDLSSLEITEPFFKMDVQVHTCYEVINDLQTERKEELQPFSKNGKLIVHKVCEEDRLLINARKFPSAFSLNEKAVIHIAQKIQAEILSSDKIVRSYLGTTPHGIFWAIDKLVQEQIIIKEEACQKLKQLINSNPFFKCNEEMNSELESRLKIWN